MARSDGNHGVDHLMSGLMGHFDLVHRAVVLGPQHQDQFDIFLTEIHELTHRDVLSSTTYGTFLRTMAEIWQDVRRTGQNPTHIPTADLETIVGLLTEKSRQVNEGYAVCREELLATIYGRTTPVRPDFYEDAYERVARASAA